MSPSHHPLRPLQLLLLLDWYEPLRSLLLPDRSLFSAHVYLRCLLCAGHCPKFLV